MRCTLLFTLAVILAAAVALEQAVGDDPSLGGPAGDGEHPPEEYDPKKHAKEELVKMDTNKDGKVHQPYCKMT